MPLWESVIIFKYMEQDKMKGTRKEEGHCDFEQVDMSHSRNQL